LVCWPSSQAATKQKIIAGPAKQDILCLAWQATKHQPSSYQAATKQTKPSNPGLVTNPVKMIVLQKIKEFFPAYKICLTIIAKH
jgi:hypothetical protein